MHLLRLFICCSAESAVPSSLTEPETPANTNVSVIVSEEERGKQVVGECSESSVPDDAPSEPSVVPVPASAEPIAASTASEAPSSSSGSASSSTVLAAVKEDVVSHTVKDAPPSQQQQVKGIAMPSLNLATSSSDSASSTVNTEEERQRKRNSRELGTAARTVSCAAIIDTTLSPTLSPRLSPRLASPTAAGSSSAAAASTAAASTAATTDAVPSSSSTAASTNAPLSPSLSVAQTNAGSQSATKAAPPPRPFLVPRRAASSNALAPSPSASSVPPLPLTRPTTLGVTPRHRSQSLSLSSGRTPSQRQLTSRQQLTVLRTSLAKTLASQWETVLPLLIAQHCPLLGRERDRESLVTMAQRLAKRVLDFFVAALLDLEASLKTSSGEILSLSPSDAADPSLSPSPSLSLLPSQQLSKLYEEVFVSCLDSLSLDREREADKEGEREKEEGEGDVERERERQFLKAKRMLFLKLLIDLHEAMRELGTHALLLSLSESVANSQLQQALLSPSLSPPLSPEKALSLRHPASLRAPSPPPPLPLLDPVSLSPAESTTTESPSVSSSTPMSASRSASFLSDSSDPIVSGEIALSLALSFPAPPPPPPLVPPATPPQQRGSSLSLSSATSHSHSLSNYSLSLPASHREGERQGQREGERENECSGSSPLSLSRLLSPNRFPEPAAVEETLRREFAHTDAELAEVPLLDCHLSLSPTPSLSPSPSRERPAPSLSHQNSFSLSLPSTSHNNSSLSLSCAGSERVGVDGQRYRRTKSVRFREPLVTVCAHPSSLNLTLNVSGTGFGVASGVSGSAGGERERSSYWSELLADVDEVQGDDLDDDDSSLSVPLI